MESSTEKKTDNAKYWRIGLTIFAVLLIVTLILIFRSCILDRLAESGKTGDEESPRYPIELRAEGNGLTVSLDGTIFSESVRLSKDGTEIEYATAGGTEKTAADVKLPEGGTAYATAVSGDGKTFFDKSGKAVSDGDLSYITLKLTFKATAATDVYLSGESYARGAELIVNATGKYYRPASGDKFSRDGAAGAVRISFCETENGTDTLKTVWIPNDGYRLSSGSFELNCAAGRRESASGYRYATASGNGLWTSDDFAVGSVAVGSDMLGGAYGGSAARIRSSLPLLSFSGAGETKVLTVRIWFDSFDRESDESLLGGICEYLLSFVGIKRAPQQLKLLDSTALSAESASRASFGENERYVYFNTKTLKLCFFSGPANFPAGSDEALEPGVLLFSRDGIDWQQYSSLGESDSVVPGEERQTIYIRLAETSEFAPGNVVKTGIPAVSEIEEQPDYAETTSETAEQSAETTAETAEETTSVG